MVERELGQQRERTFRAVVFGATGATGREVVRELAETATCSKVNAVSRREIQREEFDKVFPGISEEGKDKVSVKAVDFERFKDTIGDTCKESDAAFCCLGTTQKDAGGRKGFTKVDLDYTVDAARECKEAGVAHFALVTAAGVYWNVPRICSNYIWTKARAEEEVVKLRFSQGASIWHPGLLGRGDLTRSGGEALAQWLGFKGIPVAQLGKAMTVYVSSLVSGRRVPPLGAAEFFENKDIKRIAQEGESSQE
jgi:oxidoreductase